MKLILPVAGKSSRFEGMRPKWLLTLPNGELMIERSLSGIDLENISEIVLIMLEEHEQYINPLFLKELLEKKAKNIPVKIFKLSKGTPSQPATISSYLKTLKKDFSFFVKDCDNYFQYKPQEENNVAYINLGSLKMVDAGSKSYINSNTFGEIELIAEKTIISDKFCCGGYGFYSSALFLKSYEELGGDNNSDLYVSHIIQKNLLEGITYHSYEAFEYEDYGTSNEFQNYSRTVKSIFSDFDGVLVKNSSKFDNPPWQYIPIKENINYICNYLKNSPYSKLIITTSRPESEKENISNFLRKNDIKCHQIVTDLPHASRILINDFSKTNPFPSATSINIKRNSTNLSDYL